MNIDKIEIGRYYVCSLPVKTSKTPSFTNLVISEINDIDAYYNWSIERVIVKILNKVDKYRVLAEIHGYEEQGGFTLHCSSLHRSASLKEIILENKERHYNDM